MQDLALLSDILPTGFHGCIQAGVTAGSTVYIAGAGPVGLAAAASAQLLGAACVIVGDLNSERLMQARSMGCETVDVSSDVPIDEQLRCFVESCFVGHPSHALELESSTLSHALMARVQVHPWRGGGRLRR